jgi:hypothetical protein
VLLRVIKAILVRVRSVPLGILHPDFVQSIVDRTGDDVHLRERAAEMYDTATTGNEEGDEDDMRWFNAMIEEDSDGHEACCACTDLQAGSVRRLEEPRDRVQETKRQRACASRRKTHVFTALCLSRMQLGSLTWKSRGSPVFESDCTSKEPIATSLMTRCKPNSRGPPLE